MAKADAKGKVMVCILGSPLDVQNLGCRALGASLVDLFRRAIPNVRITFMFGNREGGTRAVYSSEGPVQVDVVNYRLSPKAKLGDQLAWILIAAVVFRMVPLKSFRQWLARKTPWIRTLVEADFIGDICAGDSFSDIYGYRRFLLTIAPSFTTLMLGRDIVFLPQTYGPYKSRWTRWLASYMLRRGLRIYSRDIESMELLRSLLGEERYVRKVRFCPDVAFCLPSIDPDEIRVEPPLQTVSSKPLLGINVSGLLFEGAYTSTFKDDLRERYRQSLLTLLSKLIECNEYKILLIPHGFSQDTQSDSGACVNVLSLLPETLRHRISILCGDYDQHEIKGIIGGCDFFIGSRLHACIAAIGQCVPTAAIAYSRKFRGVFETVGLGDMVVGLADHDTTELVNRMLDLIKRGPEIRTRLSETIPKTRNLVLRLLQDEFIPLGKETRTFTDESAEIGS